MKKVLRKFKNLISFKFSLKLIFVIAILFVIFNISYKPSTKKVKAEDPINTYNINSAQDLIDYSIAYAQGDRNKLDTLVIAINSGDRISDTGFISIGTSERPFSGIISAPVAGATSFLLFDVALFDYVSTDMVIDGSGYINIQRAQNSKTNGSLFANHVVKGTNNANWKINLDTYSFFDPSCLKGRS